MANALYATRVIPVGTVTIRSQIFRGRSCQARDLGTPASMDGSSLSCDMAKARGALRELRGMSAAHHFRSA